MIARSESLSASPASPVKLQHTARETVESIIVAVILAFLFRGFVAEAFVIPTGSMAPTLQGRHMDVVCSECRHQYRTGASVENDEFGPPRGEVVATRCPICRYAMDLDKESNVNHRSFNGDRILVSKFAYEFSSPRRWDVIVFKYPGNARINYIKRLIGLPGETIRIRHGDIWTLDTATASLPPEQQRFQIQRKPPDKVLALLQLVDDSRFYSGRMQKAHWPERWIPDDAPWQELPGGAFQVPASTHAAWLRYRHSIPKLNDWRTVGHGEPLQVSPLKAGRLIMDYYAYNDSIPDYEPDAQHWVGDLALETEVTVGDQAGQVLLDLVEGGVHFRCAIDTESGVASLSSGNGDGPTFRDAEGQAVGPPKGSTSLRRGGSYELRFANVDNQLHLWVDNRVVKFDGPTTYEPAEDVVPRWSPTDPGDFLPAGVGAQGVELLARRLRILRDVYYRAVDSAAGRQDSDYETANLRSGDNLETVATHPETWATTNLFAARGSVTFKLEEDQFFPLGDNSPQSKDARLWSNFQSEPPPYVHRSLLIGKALAIYWPHGWRVGTDQLGFIPNFQRIGLIR